MFKTNCHYQGAEMAILTTRRQNAPFRQSGALLMNLTFSVIATTTPPPSIVWAASAQIALASCCGQGKLCACHLPRPRRVHGQLYKWWSMAVPSCTSHVSHSARVGLSGLHHCGTLSRWLARPSGSLPLYLPTVSAITVWPGDGRQVSCPSHFYLSMQVSTPLYSNVRRYRWCLPSLIII